MPLLLRIAIILGAVPLIIGTLIYGTWRFTHSQWLESAGLITIAGGMVAFLSGTVLLLIHLWRELRVRQTDRRFVWIRAATVGSLLLINFPVAAFYVLSAINVATRYTVCFYNDSRQPVQSLIITGPGIRVDMGAIAPGGRARQHLQFRGDGSLDFSVRQQEKQFSGQVDGYVTHGLGGNKEVRLKDGGVFEVSPHLR